MELKRRLTDPTNDDLTNLKRMIRYLLTTPCRVAVYPWRELSSEFTADVDANWAGCLRTRKSTKGRSISREVPPDILVSDNVNVSTLCGESELAVVVKGFAEGLWVVARLADYD